MNKTTKARQITNVTRGMTLLFLGASGVVSRNIDWREALQWRKDCIAAMNAKMKDLAIYDTNRTSVPKLKGRKPRCIA